ncbi:MAG: hypothetical protein JWN43_3868 [Gammaproteobacteria bacterium]|nr:hypothetical protein [Gammaproteobacteria bacterium]
MKIVYATDRKPGVSREQFVRRWRSHGSFAMAMPGFFGSVRRYVHSDPLLDLSQFPDSTDYDGVGELHYPSVEACMTSMQSAELRQSILADGDQVFDRRRMITVAVDEPVSMHGREGIIKMYAFVTAHTEVDRERFRQSWEARQCSLLAAPGPVRDLVRKAVHCRPVHIGQPLSDLDVLTELSFDSLEDVRTAYSAWRIAIAADNAMAGEVKQLVAVVSRPRVLYDADDYGVPENN